MNAVLLDDHKLFSISVKMLLEEEQIFDKIECFDVVDDFEKHLSKEKTGILFADYSIPEVDMTQKIARWSQQYPSLKIIILSGIIDASAISELISKGAKAFLSKSASIKEIKDAVKWVMNNRVYISNDMKDAVLNATFTDHQRHFTPRENEIIYWIKKGKSIKEKSAILNLSEHTIIVHRRNIMRKANVKSINELIIKLNNTP